MVAKEIKFSCQIEVTTLGDSEPKYITACARNIEVVGERFCCGFYEFCDSCDKRFICATLRK